jgi:hypothetical protein
MWGDAWESRNRGAILNRTNGFRALMRVLRPVYLKLGKPGDVVSIDLFKQTFDQLDISSDRFTTEYYPPGTSGESALRRDLLNWLGLPEGR